MPVKKGFTVCIHAPSVAVSHHLIDILHDGGLGVYIIEDLQDMQEAIENSIEDNYVLIIRVYMLQNHGCTYFSPYDEDGCTEVTAIFTTESTLIRDTRILLLVSAWLQSFDEIETSVLKNVK